MTKLLAKEHPDAELVEKPLGFGLKATFVLAPETREGYREDRDGNDVMADRSRAERTGEKKKSA